MKNILTIFFITCTLLSCKNQTNNDNSLNQKLDSLLNENKKLNEKISSIENKNETAIPQPIENAPATNNANQVPFSNDNGIEKPTTNFENKKYAFVLLSVVKKEFDSDKWQRDLDLERQTGINLPDKGYSMVNYYITSKIETFNNFNDDTKYKFIDEVQSDLKRSSIGFNLESIKKRQCLVYNTYKEASLARAKYTTDEN